MAIRKKSLKELVKQVLTEKENRRYVKLLAARCVTYDKWVAEREKAALQAVCEHKETGEQSCDFTIFTMPWGRKATHAEELIAQYFAEHPEVQILYGDEDVWNVEGAGCNSSQSRERQCPWFKPDWSPDLFDSWYYLGSLVAIRKELLEKCPYPQELQPGDERIVSWIRECLEACGGWKQGCKAIGHLSQILFHCENEASINQYYEWKTLEQQRENNKETDVIYVSERSADCEKTPELSIIIPSKDHPDILEKCIVAIKQYTQKIKHELIIVDNGSSEENKKYIEVHLENYKNGTESQKLSGVKYIYRPMEFNFSRMCNMGAEVANGKFLLFLNDDVELCRESRLEELVQMAEKEHAGAVGMKLYYPSSHRMQHAGITNLPMGPVHKLQFLEDGGTYYFNANRGFKNVLAVTAACLMIDARKFQEVNGFDEELRVAFNDVDFCFKLYEAGYANVCNNDCYAYHHESLSRGDDESLEKWRRLLEERDCLYAKHPALEGRDPYYGAGLGREGLDTRIRPTYETAGNKVQQLSQIEAKELVGCRQDNCLLLRVENCRQGVLQGYGVVLGDNNACYEKTLLFQKVSGNGDLLQSSENAYGIIIEGQYRPDLVENMPDQCNVGLSGFWMEIGAKNEVGAERMLEKGNYRIGMLARNRVTGLKLINWSSRIFVIE